MRLEGLRCGFIRFCEIYFDLGGVICLYFRVLMYFFVCFVCDYRAFLGLFWVWGFV